MQRWDSHNPPAPATLLDLAIFLHNHLGEYGDTLPAIQAALQRAVSAEAQAGGYVLAGYLNEQLAGVVVMLDTHMQDYVPEHLLVYIAVDGSHRGQGLGRQLMQAALHAAKGSVALHVEADNPARKLYERLGFSNPYLEMRWSPDQKA